MRHIIILLAFMLTAPQAFARPLTASEYTSLSAVVENYTADILKKQFDGIFKVTPDRLINHISGIVEIGPEEFRGMLATKTKELMSDVTIHSFEVNLSDLAVTDAQNTNGTPVIYSVIPYTMLMSLYGKPYNETTTLLALYETGQWWLVRFDPAQTEQLIELYPFLKDVDF